MAKEKCVKCGKETSYDFETHIDLRSYYIEGIGQFCRSCFNDTPKLTEENQDYANFSSKDNLNKIVISEDLVRETPNNYELGEKIRRLFS